MERLRAFDWKVQFSARSLPATYTTRGLTVALELEGPHEEMVQSRSSRVEAPVRRIAVFTKRVMVTPCTMQFVAWPL